ncbi:MAG TPA: OsmC family protein [Longimicrobiales bacterium]
MANTEVTIQWSGDGLQFEAAHPSGNHYLIDGDGKTAYSPVQAFALAFAGCTGADIVDIAQKMRVHFSALSVQVSGERNAEPPRYFKTMHITYRVTGLAAEDRSKVERAIALSQEKYCSVLHSLRKDLKISSELVVE